MDQLPQEIINVVVIYSDQNSKLRLRQTCTTLFKIIDHKKFVIYFARSKLIPIIVETLSRYQHPLSLTFIKSKKVKPKALNCLSKLTNITNLSIDFIIPAKKAKDVFGLSRLTNLQSFNFRLVSHNPKILKRLNQLTRLEISIRDINDVLERKSNLVALDFAFADLNELAKFPYIGQLTSLKIGPYTERDGDGQFHALAKATNLKVLDLDRSRYYMISKPLHIPSLTNIESIHLDQPLSTELCSTKLTSLTLSSIDISDSRRALALLTNLKTLDLNLDPSNLLEKDTFNFLTALINLHDFKAHISRFTIPRNTMQVLPTSLTALDIQATQRYEEISRLVNLKSLVLGTFDLAQDVDFNYLTSMPLLTRFEIKNSRFTFDTLTDYVTKLTNLKVLSVLEASVSGKINFKARLKFPYLERLYLPLMTAETFNALSDATRLTHLSTEILEDLDLYNNALEKVPLRSLQLQFIKPKEQDRFWQILTRLTSLESLACDLSIENDQKIDVAERRIRSLTVLRHLTRLNIRRGPHINVNAIIWLTTLQCLEIPFFGLDDEKSTRWSEQCYKLTKVMPYLFCVRHE